MVRIVKTTIAILLIVLNVNTAYAAFRLGKNGPRIKGFVENSWGIKLGNDQTRRDEFNMLEQRLQLKTSIYPEWTDTLADWMTEIEAKGDFTVDEYFNGRTDAHLRVLSIAFTPISWMDIKAGRQVFTWGTGDYVFINDLFPKDYVSFYIGREDEYLKKPNDALRVSLYSETVNVNIIAIPVFEPNTIFEGDRLSFFDPFQGGIAGTNSERRIIGPDGKTYENAEYALRFYRNFESYEGAVYFFRGQYKNPVGYLDEMNRELFYPRLDAYGASIRGPSLGGIVNAEMGFYNSRQDDKGDNRLIQNSQIKYLIGYARDLGNDWSLGLQYLFEKTLDYGAYSDVLLPQDFAWDEYRHLNTLRLSKLYKNQTVRANIFVFFSPSDLDGYVRPSIDYDMTDSLKLTLGANLSWGEDVHTEFGQTEHNKNIYTRIRYSF